MVKQRGREGCSTVAQLPLCTLIKQGLSQGMVLLTVKLAVSTSNHSDCNEACDILRSLQRTLEPLDLELEVC